MIYRSINLLKYLNVYQSLILLGPRGTGKSTLIRESLKDFPHLEVDLLKSNNFSKYLATPELLCREIEYFVKNNSSPCAYIFIDEIQKIPTLLDEVHALIEKYKERICFILSGSSARKLKKSGANLLAGRAVSLRLHVFSYFECASFFNLEQVLKYGQLPILHDKKNDLLLPILKTYVDTYLREEILQESLVRNLEPFIHFLDLAAQYNGENINFSKMAKSCGLSHITIKTYFQILSDTLVAHLVPGWSRSIKKQITKSPKCYLFDIGVINTLQGEVEAEVKLNSNRGGKIFETFIVNEVRKILDYNLSLLKIYYWRSKEGYEVDMILSKSSFSYPIAFEIKSSTSITEDDLKGLREFKKEEVNAKLYCISNCERPYSIEGIDILPWPLALEKIKTNNFL